MSNPCQNLKKVTRDTPKSVTGYFFTLKLVEKNPSRTNQNQNQKHTLREPIFFFEIQIIFREQHPEKLETKQGTAFFNLIQSYPLRKIKTKSPSK